MMIYVLTSKEKTTELVDNVNTSVPLVAMTTIVKPVMETVTEQSHQTVIVTKDTTTSDLIQFVTNVDTDVKFVKRKLDTVTSVSMLGYYPEQFVFAPQENMMMV